MVIILLIAKPFIFNVTFTSPVNINVMSRLARGGIRRDKRKDKRKDK